MLALSQLWPQAQADDHRSLRPACTVAVPGGFAPLPRRRHCGQVPRRRASRWPCIRRPQRRAWTYSVAGAAHRRSGPRTTTCLLPALQGQRAAACITKVEFLNQEVRQVHGRDFVALEFVSDSLQTTVGAVDHAGAHPQVPGTCSTRWQGEQLYVFFALGAGRPPSKWRPVARLRSVILARKWDRLSLRAQRGNRPRTVPCRCSDLALGRMPIFTSRNLQRAMLTDDYFMAQALQEPRAALAAGEIPIGAVVVLENKIIGRGHNQTERLRDVTAHAEMLALTAAANHGPDKYLASAPST
ncbi:MAG: deaminase [Hymenobacter sp.]